MLAAIDEGDRDTRAGRTIPMEEVRKMVPQWIADAALAKVASRPECVVDVPHLRHGLRKPNRY